MNTQSEGDVLMFRWHDSLFQQGASFTSGMDDFPRPPVSKANIDLQSWMYFFTKFMVEVAHIYDEDGSRYIASLELIKSNSKYFVNPVDRTYRDISKDEKFSPHFGYPNILPIAFGIPTFGSDEYNATIKKIKEELDIDKGLTSISKNSALYLSNRGIFALI